MLIDFPDFEGYLLEHGRENLMKKGKGFMKKHFVKHIHAFSGNEWDVYVESEREGVPGYTVRIKIQGNKVVHKNCNCLGFRFGPLCKHIVAALTAIRAEKLYDSDIGEYEGEETDEEEEVEKEQKSGKNTFAEDEMEEEPEIKEAKKEPKAKGTRKIPAQKDLTERELECQICRDTVEDPVTYPCQAHSVCLKCAQAVLENAKRMPDGMKELVCPHCGKKEGVIRLKDPKDLKSNRELGRVRRAYEKEKENWLKEKERLEKELEELRSQSQKAKGKDQIEEERKLEQTLEEVDSEKLKDLAEKEFFSLKNEGEDVEKITDELKENKEKAQEALADRQENNQDNQIQVNFKEKDTKKGKGKKGTLKDKEMNGNRNQKKSGSKEKETNIKTQESGKDSGKRSRSSVYGDKENDEIEGTGRYDLRTKKVKTYAE